MPQNKKIGKRSLRSVIIMRKRDELLPYRNSSGTYEVYQGLRRRMLEDYLYINKYLNPNIKQIVGIGFETRKSQVSLSSSFFKEGQDFIFADFSTWDAENTKYAKAIYDEYVETKLLAPRSAFNEKNFEFSENNDANSTFTRPLDIHGEDGERDCLCGSGEKFKNCCSQYFC